MIIGNKITGKDVLREALVNGYILQLEDTSMLRKLDDKNDFFTQQNSRGEWTKHKEGMDDWLESNHTNVYIIAGVQPGRGHPPDINIHEAI